MQIKLIIVDVVVACFIFLQQSIASQQKRESKGFDRAKWPNGLKYYGSPNNKGKN